MAVFPEKRRNGDITHYEGGEDGDVVCAVEGEDAVGPVAWRSFHLGEKPGGEKPGHYSFGPDEDGEDGVRRTALLSLPRKPTERIARPPAGHTTCEKPSGQARLLAFVLLSESYCGRSAGDTSLTLRSP